MPAARLADSLSMITGFALTKSSGASKYIIVTIIPSIAKIPSQKKIQKLVKITKGIRIGAPTRIMNRKPNTTTNINMELLKLIYSL